MNYVPGIYEAQSVVNIRREPRIVDIKIGGVWVTNQVGRIDAGTRRFLDSFITNKDNSTWGRVSEADSAGISEWICVQNINRVFMKPVDGGVVVPPPTGDLENRLFRLEAWARTQGYNG